MCMSVIAVVLLTGRTLSIMLTDMVVSDRDTEVYMQHKGIWPEYRLYQD